MSMLIKHVEQSIEKATNHISDLSDEILKIDGMSSPKMRHFLNNITKLEKCNYLEIGCWKGSTLISALFKNNVQNYWAIDNFSEFGSPKNEFIQNFSKILNCNPNLIDKDFTSFNPIDYGIKDVNVYFYDGYHMGRCQELALSHYINSLQDEFIYICDDWNGWAVASQTQSAIKELKLNVLYEKVLPAKYAGDIELWWNGVYVAVLKKSTN